MDDLNVGIINAAISLAGKSILPFKLLIASLTNFVSASLTSSAIIITCEMEKRPIKTGIEANPPIRLTLPNVYLGNPICSSIPIQLIHNPIAAESNPLETPPVQRLPITVSPNIATKKYSAGPNINESLAKGGAINNSIIPLANPPRPEQIVETPKA